jgi:hypothetical protein
MARNYLTSLNLNKNELLNARIQNLANAPASPRTGQIYFDTALGHLRQYDGSAWITYTTAAELQTALTTGTQTNITVSFDTNTGTYSFVAENGVADSTTADLAEDPNATTSSGTMYFTNERAIAAVGGSATSTNTPDTVVKRDSSGNFAAGQITANEIVVQTAGNIFEDSALNITSTAGNDINISANQDVNITSANGDIVLNADGNVYKGSVTTSNEIITQGRLDSYIGDNTVNGSTGNTITDRIASVASDVSTVAGDLSTHISDTSAHGVTGNVVGDTDAQTLTNKTLGTGTVLSADVDANGNTITDLGLPAVDSDAATKGYADGILSDHASDTSTHGVGEIVGTTEVQTLTNKVLGATSSLGADLDADGYKVTNLGTPTDPSDAANKAYVDNAVAGLTWKPAVHLLATSNVALTGDTDTLVIDSHASLDSTHVGYRILLTAQTTDTENGIYVYADNGTAYTLTRPTDSDVYTELKGATVFVQEGTTYGQSAWTQGNTYLTSFADQDWVQFSGAAQIVAGAGITKTGNQLDVIGTTDRIHVNADSVDISENYVGQTSITTLGTVTTGVWNGTDIAVADGGTGASTAAGARANLGATTKFTETNAELVPSSDVVTWTVSHNLGIRTVLVQVYDLAGFEEVEVDIERTNTSTVTLSWVAATTVAANSYQVVIIG